MDYPEQTLGLHLRLCMLPTALFTMQLAAGIMKHPAYKVTVAPTWAVLPYTRRIRGLNALPALHWGAQKCFPVVNHPGRPAWPDRQAWEAVGNIPLGPVLPEPQDQMRHMDGLGTRWPWPDLAISRPRKAPHGAKSQEMPTLEPGNCRDQFFIYPL